MRLTHPESPAFLGVRFKQLRWWLYRLQMRRHRRPQMYRAEKLTAHLQYLRSRQKIFDCPHDDRRPNPAATAVLDQNPEICNLCGVGMTTWRRR